MFGAWNIVSALLLWLSPVPPRAPKFVIEEHSFIPTATTTSAIPQPTLECQTPFTDGFPSFIDPLAATVQELGLYLKNGTISSSMLVQEYLSRIQHLDRSSTPPYPLNSIIETMPIEIALPIAQHLDELRANGTVLSPLHGIPILVKDNIGTHLSLGMNTTSGSYSLLPEHAGSVPDDSAVVKKLRKAGAIIIGKTNMSEFASARGDNTTFSDGYSSRGGQTYSAHVSGGNPSGSSSGSAVAVAAGFAPASLGTDTDGSITGPASKAGLYALKPSVGLIGTEGVVPWSKTQDAIGIFGKTVWDIATVLDQMTDSNASYVPHGINGIGIAVMNPEYWISDVFTGDHGVEAITALKSMEKRGALVDYDNVSVPSILSIIESGNGNESVVLRYERKRDIEAYLKTLLPPIKKRNDQQPLRSLQDIVRFNAKHVDKKLCCQEGFVDSINVTLSATSADEEAYKESLSWNLYLGRTTGLDAVFDKFANVTVLAIPSDGAASILPSLSGHPIATVPLGVEANGTPFGLSFIARRWGEADLLRVMAAYEKMAKEEERKQWDGRGWVMPKNVC